MAAPSYELAWQFFPNHYVASAAGLDTTRYVAWAIKAFLTGQIGGASTGLWTVKGSSDGATAGMDGTDRWGATYTPAKLIRAGSGARSWIVLEGPSVDGKRSRLLLSLGTSADTSMQTRFAPCDLTGGTVSAEPTVTVANSAPTQWNQVAIGTTAQAGVRIQFALAQDGSFIILWAKGGQVIFSGLLACYSVATPKPVDQWPFVALGTGTAAQGVDGASALSITNLTNNNSQPYITPHTLYLNPNPQVLYPSWSYWSATGDNIDNTLPAFPAYCGIASGNGSGAFRGRARDLLVGLISPTTQWATVRNDANAVAWLAIQNVFYPAVEEPNFNWI